MTLQQILEQYGIHQPADLADILDIDRRHAWGILHGKNRLTPRLALKLYDIKGIPLDQLLRASVAPKPAPRGRRRKRPPETHEPPEEGPGEA